MVLCGRPLVLEGASEVFNKSLLGKSGRQFKAYWAKQIFTGKGAPPKAVGVNEMLELVANNPNL